MLLRHVTDSEALSRQHFSKTGVLASIFQQESIVISGMSVLVK